MDTDPHSDLAAEPNRPDRTGQDIALYAFLLALFAVVPVLFAFTPVGDVFSDLLTNIQTAVEEPTG